ncbi:hypothetical protein BaRGS_00035062 [Batillaria attramentaria]|uniref:Cytochrome P450 n=1 Tax=Batillaria attramentaria TaxID=370345 RepID=A0ABD0JFS1_9CAEN
MDAATTVVPWLGWTVPVTLLCIVITLLYLYGTWTHTTWSSAGVSGPKPLPFLGNIGEINKKGFFHCLQEWGKQYGKMYGIYFMHRPLLMTTDVDILKEVFIKDFADFPDRLNANPLQPYPVNQGLIGVTGDRWRRQRHTLTPTFSTSKLKAMNKFITRCCHNLIAAMRKNTEEGKLLDVKQMYGSFTLDVICGTAFGFETNALGHEDNVFLNNVKAIFAEARVFKVGNIIAAVFPFTIPFFKWLGYSSMPKKEARFITETIRSAIETRRKDGGKGRVDLLQLMLDAEATGSEIAGNPQEKRLTTDEIIGQGFTVFIAGYETTATTLQYLTYLLALNPDKQEKLYREIVDTIGNAEPTYDNVTSIKYLDSCVREALRCFPPAALTSRGALAEKTIKGVKIPAGAGVGVPIIGLMRDEEFFPEPDKFIPERFDDENKDAIPSIVREMVFGAGPRQCIGMRLALYEAKMAVVTVVRQFKFVKVPETPDEITFRPGFALALPLRPVLVGTQLREA